MISHSRFDSAVLPRGGGRSDPENIAVEIQPIFMPN